MQKAPTAVICLSPYSGGMEIDSIKMAEKLSSFTETVLIAKSNHFIAGETASKERDFTLETIAFKSNLSFSIIFGVRKIIQKYAIKNVIFFGASELKSLYFSFLGLDINLIVRHGTTKSTPKKDWFHRLIYSKVNYHVGICRHLAENVKKIIPFGKNTKLKLIYSSLNFGNAVAKKTVHSPLQIVHVGRIAKGKGQIDAMRACEALFEHNIDFTLTFIGGMAEDHAQQFETIMKSFPYREKIRLAGHIGNVSDYLSHSDIFLFPSSGEGLSNAFIEALAHGLACISYDNTSFPELQELGLHFKMASNKEIASLKSVLLEVANTMQINLESSSQNIEKVKTIFSEEREMIQYKELLI